MAKKKVGRELGLKPAIIEKCAFVVKAVKLNQPFLLEIEEGNELKQVVVKRGLLEAAKILNRHLLIRRRGETMLVLRRVTQKQMREIEARKAAKKQQPRTR
ncbi:MAG: hypothetical protein IT369_20670 [Candidatus Latescibacteria bacterium]|nr:hypothetical protein [Candidatus Latescibacterota bacterium]